MPPKTKSLDEAWEVLEGGVKTIFEQKEGKLDGEVFSRAKHMTLYSEVHNFCTNSRGHGAVGNHTSKESGAALVGRELFQKLHGYLEEQCKEQLKEFQTKTGEHLMTCYTDTWNMFTFSAKVVNNLFAYLNRFWVKREVEEGDKTVREIREMCLVVWKDIIFNEIKTQLFEAVMELITRDRDGDTINTLLVRKMTDCFVALGLDDNTEEQPSSVNGQLQVYRDHFEKPFLEATSEYYQKDSDNFLQENSVIEYMKKAEKRLEEEQARVAQYLHETTGDELARTCEKVLIMRHVDRLHAEFQSLLDDERIEDLQRIYKLLKHIAKGLDPLRVLLETHVKNKGLEAIAKCTEAETDAKAYVVTLLGTHAKFTKMVKDAFDDDPSFVGALDKACRQFVNHNSVTKATKAGTARSPELLAKYCDTLLRKSSRNTGVEELEGLLDGVMVIFRYLEDNDVFQRFYSKALAKRLVNSNSASDDAEASMISKLKQTCGYEWTQKFQRMFQNMGTSKELMQKFHNGLSRNEEKLPVQDFYVMVLTSGSWPFQTDPEKVKLPPQLERCCERFTMFYMKEHQGRKLNWLLKLSKGEIVTKFTKNPKTEKPMSYTLQASTYQMAILLHFNEKDEITLEELAVNMATNGTDLLEGVIGVLLKTKLITESSKKKYKLNYGFKNKKIKVNINMPIKSEQKAEAEQVHQSIEEDRKLIIQAYIVRIMKTRKQMKHNELISTAIEQLKSRFQPKIPAIKAQIGQLIEKEYLDRVEGTRDEYVYLA